MFVTKIAGAAPSIQYQGVTDQSESNQPDGMSVGLILGWFRRGRIDKPFFVTPETVRQRLGYDPGNMSYQAVVDALDTGIPRVWVMNLNMGAGGVSHD